MKNVKKHFATKSIVEQWMPDWLKSGAGAECRVEMHRIINPDNYIKVKKHLVKGDI